MTEVLDRTNELFQAFRDPMFMEGLVRNTAEHMRIITEWLLPCRCIDCLREWDGSRELKECPSCGSTRFELTEPKIEDVATTIGVLLQASTEVRWGVGDILVAVDNRRQELNRPWGEWTAYLRAVEGMLRGAIGYHSLWNYYSTSYMVPKQHRRPDRAHTWYVEVGRLAGHMLASGTRGPRDEHREAKRAQVLELLADPKIEDMAISQLRRLREPQLPVTYRFDYPEYVDVAHTETGEVVRLLTFVDKPWSDDVLAAVHYLLRGLRIMGWSPYAMPTLIRVDHKLYTRRAGEYEPWDDELVALLGREPLVQEVYDATKLKWRVQDGE